MTTNKTLADYAEDWVKEKGEEVPERGTDEWSKMYERWIEFAFASFSYSKTNRNTRHKHTQSRNLNIEEI